MKLTDIRTAADATRYLDDMTGRPLPPRDRAKVVDVLAAVRQVDVLRGIRRLQDGRDRAGDVVGRNGWARTAEEWADTRMSLIGQRIAKNEGLLP